MSSEPQQTTTPEKESQTPTSSPGKRRVYLVTPSGEKYLKKIRPDLEKGLGESIEFLKPDKKEFKRPFKRDWEHPLSPEDQKVFKELKKGDNNRNFSGKELHALARGLSRVKNNDDPDVEYVIVSGDGLEQDLIEAQGGQSLHARDALDEVASRGRITKEQAAEHKKDIDRRDQKRIAARGMQAGLSSIFKGLHQKFLNWLLPRSLRSAAKWLSSHYREGRQNAMEKARQEIAGRGPRPFSQPETDQIKQEVSVVERQRKDMMEAMREVLREQKEREKQEQEKQPTPSPEKEKEKEKEIQPVTQKGKEVQPVTTTQKEKDKEGQPEVGKGKEKDKEGQPVTLSENDKEPEVGDKGKKPKTHEIVQQL